MVTYMLTLRKRQALALELATYLAVIALLSQAALGALYSNPSRVQVVVASEYGHAPDDDFDPAWEQPFRGSDGLNYFLLETRPKNARKALLVCQAAGKVLAPWRASSGGSPASQAVLRSLCKGKGCWTGDQAPEGKCYALCLSGLPSYTASGSTNPLGGEGRSETSGETRGQVTSPALDLVDCHTPRPFVCRDDYDITTDCDEATQQLQPRLALVDARSAANALDTFLASKTTVTVASGLMAKMRSLTAITAAATVSSAASRFYAAAASQLTDAGFGGALDWYGAPEPGFKRATNYRAPPVGSLLSMRLKAPLPTNTWHSPLGLGGDQAWAHSHPYAVKATGRGLAVSYPYTFIQNTPTTQGSGFMQEDVVLGCTETWDIPTALQPFLERTTLLATTLRWNRPGVAGAYMRAPVVRGMSAATMIYAGAWTPRVWNNGIMAVTVPPAGSTASGTRFAFTLTNGQTWVVATSKSVTVRYTMKGLDVVGGYAPGGASDALAVRVMQLPQGMAPNAAEPALNVYATSARVAFDPPRGSYTFTFKTASLNGKGKGAQLVLFALPHHLAAGLSNAQVGSLSGGRYTTIRGALTAVLGWEWRLRVPKLITTNWGAPRPIDADKRATVRSALLAEADSYSPNARDPYFAGSQYSQLGRLALIAEELGEAAVAKRVRSRLGALLSPWLRGTNMNPLLYDTTWGGLISTDSLTGFNFNFGNAQYNDHQLQYGYLTYAIACMAKGDRAWATRHSRAINNLIRDYANPSSKDKYFPHLRHMDVWESHSWSGGLFVYQDGKNQESVSEPFNAYYGLAMYGKAIQNAKLEAWGRMLASMEMQGGQAYWQVKPNKPPYNPPFANNLGVGILWSAKADYATWFGNLPEYIYAIQYIPFTPASEELLDPSWIRAQFPLVQQRALSRNGIEDGWRSFIISAQATFDKRAAWAAIQQVRSYFGIWPAYSRTAAYYWVATRP